MKPPEDTHDEVGALIRATAARVEAPLSLRAEVERLRTPRRHRPGDLRAGLAFAAAGVAALAVVMVLPLVAASPAAPPLAAAPTPAVHPASVPAPPADPSRPAVLKATIDGIA